MPATTEVVDYTTADAADAEAEQLQIRVNDLSSRETTMTAERAQLAAEAERESAAADTLSDLADRLPAHPAAESVHEALGWDLAAARAEVGATARDLDEATAALTTVTDVRAGLALEALHLAARPSYRELSLSLRERLSEGDAAVLGANAGDYVDEVELRLTQIAALFEQVRADEEHVTTVVGGHVRKLLTAIASAARASKLPAGLGELSGKQFLNLRFAKRAPLSSNHLRWTLPTSVTWTGAD